MADFNTTYDGHIQPNEGYYVNNPADPGKRTYGGIAQDIWPSWSGWPWLMNWIAQNGEPKWNRQFTNLDPQVRQFFYDLWIKNKFNQIATQQIADIFFDWFVNTIRVYATKGYSVPVKEVQKIVGSTTDGVMGPNTINAINSFDQAKLFAAIKTARENFYKTLVSKDSSLSEFLPGWLDRLKQFPDFVISNPAATGTAVVGMGFLFFLGYKFSRKPKHAKA